jgi:hypothetical protein
VAPKRFSAEFRDRGLIVPFDAKAEFGEARPPVAGTLNGFPFRGRLMVYGGVTYLGLRREIRDAAGGIEDGDRVEVQLERDDAPREARGKDAPDVARGGEAAIR